MNPTENDSIRLVRRVMQAKIKDLKDANKDKMFPMFSKEFIARHEKALADVEKLLK